MIIAAPWYIKKSNIHKDLDVPPIEMEIIRYAEKYLENSDSHINPLVGGILRHIGHIRLKGRILLRSV